MAKTKISEFSTTAGNNTDINSINIAEGCAPSGINDAIRELMRQLKEFQTGGAGDSVNSGGDFSVATNKFTVASASGNTAVAGTLAVTGTTTLTGALVANGNATLGDGSGDTVTVKGTPTLEVNPTLSGGTANGVLYLNGSKVATSGSALTFDGSNLGLGVTPSAWGSGLKAFQASTASFMGDGTATYVSSNYYYNAGNKYIGNGYATSYQTYNGQHVWLTAGNNVSGAGAAITFTQAMTLDASGNLGVGATSLSNPFTVGLNASSSTQPMVLINPTTGTNASIQYFNNGGSGGFYIGRLNSAGGGVGSGLPAYDSVVWNTGAQNILFGTNNTERARIDSSGRLLVGTTSSSPGSGAAGTIIANGDGGIFITVNTAPIIRGYSLNGGFPDLFQVANNGNVTNANNSYGAISDVKLKENIVDATPKLADMMQVRIRNYNLIGNTTKQIGVIAQELETVFPGMIEETADKDMEGNDLGTTTKSVKYSVFVPMLIKAIQELKAEFDAYKASHP